MFLVKRFSQQFFVLALMMMCLGFGRCVCFAGEQINLNHSPDYKEIARLSGRENLLAFRNALGDALAVNWKASAAGRPGSCAQENYARWVDLYQWLDHFESDETTVMRDWLARRIAVTEKQSEGRNTIHLRALQPGEKPSSSALIDKVMSDNSAMQMILGKLVAQPFAIESGILADRLQPEFISRTLSDPDFLKRWSECYRKEDVAPKVLLNLQAIWKNHPADWHEFQSLALALAVVKDQPAPDFWPHQQVAPSDVPRKEEAPEDLFAKWVEAYRAGKLRRDPRLLEVGDLKFVIDPPLTASEFDTIRNNPSLSYLDPQKAFESIHYDQGRVIKGVYDWPWGKYFLSSIKEHGGICVDQAYYASVFGKALGIPTIFFAGQGKDGGHAWVGYLKGPGRWDLNVGRYTSQNYATGEGLDPQSWTAISDHDLELLTRHLGNQDSQDAARRDLVLASDFKRKGDLSGEGRALESALQVSPENPKIWDAREEWLVRSGASLAELKAHHQAAIGNFSRFSDLKTQHEQALIDLALRSGANGDAEQLSDQIIQENRLSGGGVIRTDLSAIAAWSLISKRMKRSDFPAAMEEFERQLYILGRSGGGDFFYKVVTPLAAQLIQTGHQDLALQVLKKSFQTMKQEYDSILDRDLRKLWAKAGGAPSTPSTIH
jgi:hypothetical protein